MPCSSILGEPLTVLGNLHLIDRFFTRSDLCPFSSYKLQAMYSAEAILYNNLFRTEINSLLRSWTYYNGLNFIHK